MIIHNEPVVQAGKSLQEAKNVLIMVHGRGDSAQSFVHLAKELDIPGDFAIIAIQAVGNTWYPYSFLAPVSQNEPQLTQSLDGLKEVYDNLMELDFVAENMFFLGFSQGACLALEFCARHAKKYGGVIAFTGGLIGSEINATDYRGEFENTPIFIGSSDVDPHVPLLRIEQSETILKTMGGHVIKKIYPGMGHTINQDEIQMANLILNKSLKK
ncbi:alpha/beta hydrolase [Muricauda oceani]|uniref:Phospholipase n=1 Tax=Flagellimonas oceani TaxID=2698672 RepID=A0A6G7J099_9FLAO|nr:alpha/beta hydrolase [Allomuricauda oceani]MBW8243639.1 alpha/beta hydrolase [Allomuricauda oceani]QII43994.1 phospholipase [Allomuricauda oceani]